jgi:formylmethanofuran:tetrahydromethanopterin formyltransferase
MSEATRIPDGFPGETVEDLIEKQAIMDVLLESRVWSRNYLSNPFPYIFEDITKIDKQDLEKYKLLFQKHYKKYS